jgi:hypothetical protein
MKRWYHLEITISGVHRARCGLVTAAVETVWPVDEWRRINQPGADGGVLAFVAAGDGALAAGDTVQALAARLTEAVWTAHDAFCTVAIAARCLDPHPIERLTFDAGAYARHQAQATLLPAAD